MTKKIFKSIGLIALAVAVAIGSFFVPISKKGTSHLANADSTQTSVIFNGSNIWLPVSRSADINSYLVDQLLININFSIDRLNNTFNYNFNGTTGFYNSGDWSYQGLTYNYYVFEGLTPDYSTTINLGLVFDISYSRYQSASYYNNNGFLEYALKGSQFPIDSEIVSVSMGYVETVDTNFDYPSNFIKYTDANNNFITFYFKTITGSSTANRLVDRTYYFPSAFDLTESQFYNEGYNQGLLANQDNIYTNGYNTGFDDGFEDGKITGAIEANDYSFFSLFGAIFDAPVTLFTSLLNFNFLGINLWSFITSLLTLAIILFVVKLFIRR